MQNVGGWANPLIVDYYADYARVLFDRFGDRVKIWLTVNEPKNVCALGYGTIYLAPGYVNQSGIADYMCGHNILLAHARAYHMYTDEYKPWQNGKLLLYIDDFFGLIVFSRKNRYINRFNMVRTSNQFNRKRRSNIPEINVRCMCNFQTKLLHILYNVFCSMGGS